MSELKELKSRGQAFLGKNQIEQAESIFVSILREHPQDVEAYILLGDCYQARDDHETAVLLYTEALKFDPNNAELQKRRSETVALIVDDLSDRIEQAALPNLRPLPAEPLPNDPPSVANLLQKITGNTTPVSEEEVIRAADILDEVISSPRPALAVAEHLDEIDDLLPALLELNIRQARADGRPDLAQGLEALLYNIQLQVMDREENGGMEANEGAAGSSRRMARTLPNVLNVLFLAGGSEIPSRVSLSADALASLGYQAQVAADFPENYLDQFDAVVTHNPHGNPQLLPGLAACAAKGIPVIVDLDMDFEQMPINHPDYPRLGLGTQAAAKAYKASLELADLICVPNRSLGAGFESHGYKVKVIPNGWSRKNGLWEKPSARRHTLNLGWIGIPGQLDDVAQIRRVVVRILREFQQVKLIVVGDSQVYQLFDSVPEARRLFLPPVQADDYPYLLGQIDALVVPLRNTPYNQNMSDQQLMEAGIRQIPWVASPVPSFTDWSAGGMVANSLDEWHTHLRQIVMDANVRMTLGKAGRLKAEGREMGVLGRIWMDMIASCVQARYNQQA